jgi:hypothetical protein
LVLDDQSAREVDVAEARGRWVGGFGENFEECCVKCQWIVQVCVLVAVGGSHCPGFRQHYPAAFFM